MRTSIIFLFALTLALTGCGGGGGGNVRPSTEDFTPRTTRDAYSADPRQAQTAAARAATSLPRFGSVTQSQARDIAGVSTDAANVTLNSLTGQGVLTVTRSDGSRLVLDSARHTLVSDEGISPVTSRDYAAGVLLNANNTALTAAYVAAEWDPGYGNWLAGGYWFHIKGNLRAGHVTGAEMGAFVDGPEISTAANVPLLGNATYHGLAAGLGVQRMGTEGIPFGIPQGTYLTGEYAGELELIARFATGQITGVIDQMYVSGVAETPNGDTEPFEGDNPTVIYLQALDINGDGTFRGAGVTVTHPLYQIVESEGSWGGRFSAIDDREGNPRLVAGTHGVTLSTTGGTEAAFVGAFYGATDAFE